MLYDDANQVEVRYVISLAHHDVSIYGGEGVIPEGELWLKRNAISLSRRLESLGDLGGPTSPFFFFSDNLSEKEDFYFALLQNQRKIMDACDHPPKYQGFDVKHIVTLVQRLHSSEEQLQTRWINAVLGRIFLALYRTPEMEDFVKTKIVKKISRVNKPSFISNIGLRSIDMGTGAPFIINPRLKDLTADGNCCVETDVQYTGNFRVEISATVRIDLGPRFKAREVDIVLAVVLRKLEGHLLVRFKPPPSNRAWISFETMPNMVMDIEPIVSSKQITFGIILRTIESKIREMVAESIVFPFWDDVPFLDTIAQQVRGGIWQRQSSESNPTVDIPDDSGTRAPMAENIKDDTLKNLKSKDDRTMSAPALSESAGDPSDLRKSSGRAEDSEKVPSTALPSSAGNTTHSPPRAIRSRTFSHTADPVLTADHGQMDGILSDFKDEEKNDAASAMIEISSRSPPATPNKTPNGSPPGDNQIALDTSRDSREYSTDSSVSTGEIGRGLFRRLSSAQTSDHALNTRMHSSSSLKSNQSHRPSIHGGSHRSVDQSIATDKKFQGSLTLGTAASMAKKWGWNMLGRGEPNASQGLDPSRSGGNLQEPMGRGHPLPPPGTPLPTPAKVNSKRNSVSAPKRKPVPPATSHDQEMPEDNRRGPSAYNHSFPRRKPVFRPEGDADRPDSLLVIEAPHESTPDSPVDFAPDSRPPEQSPVPEGVGKSIEADRAVQSRQNDAQEHDASLTRSSKLNRSGSDERNLAEPSETQDSLIEM